MNRLAVPFHGRIIGFPYWNKVGGAAAPDPTLIYDTFTDADATALSAHTIAPTNVPGNAWASIGYPVPIIESNQLKPNGVNAFVVVDAETADATVSIDFTHATGSNFNGMVVRITNDSNYWRIYNASGTWNLLERTAGANSVRATSSQTLTNGQTYALTLVLDAATITFKVDAVQSLAYASATAHETVTKHGIYMSISGSSAQRIDNFKVTSS